MNVIYGLRSTVPQSEVIMIYVDTDCYRSRAPTTGRGRACAQVSPPRHARQLAITRIWHPSRTESARHEGYEHPTNYKPQAT